MVGVSSTGHSQSNWESLASSHRRYSLPPAASSARVEFWVITLQQLLVVAVRVLVAGVNTRKSEREEASLKFETRFSLPYRTTTSVSLVCWGYFPQLLGLRALGFHRPLETLAKPSRVVASLRTWQCQWVQWIAMRMPLHPHWWIVRKCSCWLSSKPTWTNMLTEPVELLKVKKKGKIMTPPSERAPRSTLKY